MYKFYCPKEKEKMSENYQLRSQCFILLKIIDKAKKRDM